MAKIMQDFKDWKKAKQDSVMAQQNLSEQFNNMLEQISLSHYGHNFAMEAAFIKSAPDPKTNPQEYKQYMDNYAHVCHAYPCFYVMYNPFDNKNKSSYTETQVTRCMNNQADGTIYESFCHGCPAFEDLVKYQSLYAHFKSAQEKQKEAMYKFFDNFMFWKQNGR